MSRTEEAFHMKMGAHPRLQAARCDRLSRGQWREARSLRRSQAKADGRHSRRCRFLHRGRGPVPLPRVEGGQGCQSKNQEDFAVAAEAAGASYWLVHDFDEVCTALNTIGVLTRPLIASGVHGGPGAQPPGQVRPVSGGPFTEGDRGDGIVRHRPPSRSPPRSLRTHRRRRGKEKENGNLNQ